MTKVRSVFTGLLFLASCAALLGAHQVAQMVLGTYSAGHIETFGPRVPAFSLQIVSYMLNSLLICGGTLALSLVLAALAWSRAATRESRIGWISVLASLNYHVAFFLVGAIAVGFFALPKLANGA